MRDLPIEVWWKVYDWLKVDDLLKCTILSRWMMDSVLAYKPGKVLDLSALSPLKRRRFTCSDLTPCLKQIIVNHRGLDMSRTLIKSADLEVLLPMNLDWIQLDYCANISGRTAANIFIKILRKNKNITTDLYMLNVGSPLRMGSVEPLVELRDRARVYIHECRDDYTEMIRRRYGDADEMAPCHQCGVKTDMYTSCSGCRLCTCDKCLASKCLKPHDDIHSMFCSGCINNQECTLCKSYCCTLHFPDGARVVECIICGLRSCTSCTPSIIHCSKCWSEYCGQCLPNDSAECTWKCWK